MNYEIYIVGSIEIVGSIRISWGCDGIYESYVIAPIVPIIPIISIMGRYRQKKTRVDAFEFVRGTFLCLAVRGRPDGAARGCFSWICLCVN